MKKYNKKTESREDYKINREKRIKELLDIANVDHEEYV